MLKNTYNDMKEELDLYRMSYSDDTTDGIFAVSLVDEPAIEVDFIYFNKEKQNFSVENEEKRLVVGPILIPNQKIYRRDRATGYEYNVYFTQEDIDKFSEKFMLNNNNNNVTLNHQVTGNGVKMVYFWKSTMDNELGFGTPKGTLFASYKVLNDKIWSEVKDGTFNGFSVEFFSTPIKVENFDKDSFIEKDVDTMNEEEIKELIKIIGEEIQSKNK